MRKPAHVPATVLAVTLMATACGGGGSTTASPAQTTPAPSSTAPPTPGNQVHVFLQDGGFLPRDITIVTGGTIELTNSGNIPHTFTVEPVDIDEVVQPGGEVSMTVTAAAGTYDLICRFHELMRGTLTVSG